MHFSAERGLAIACRLSVRLSVCDVGDLWSHRQWWANPKYQISKTQIKSNLQILNLKSFLNLQKLTHYRRK